MGYERDGRPSRDYYSRSETQDYGRDYGADDRYSSSSARDYRAAAAYDGGRDYDQTGHGRQREGGAGGGRPGGYGPQQSRYGGQQSHGSYGSDGRPFVDVGSRRDWDDDDRRPDCGRPQGRGQQRPPQGYDHDDRGFFARAGDEVRSWFGDEDAEQRREADTRYDERAYGDRDDDYRSWRSTQVAALDRDYDEYRRENRSKFHNEFATWRTERQGQRDSLGKVSEHMEVVGSDGSHVGTVDKVRGDRILLTKNDEDAGGRHHSIPSRWITSVDDKVTLAKTADEAKRQWQDEERSQAMSGYGDKVGGDKGGDRDDDRGTDLNRSFSGTY